MVVRSSEKRDFGEYNAFLLDFLIFIIKMYLFKQFRYPENVKKATLDMGFPGGASGKEPLLPVQET